MLIGVIGLGAVVTTGTWAKRRADAREQVEAQAIRQDASAALSALTDYRARCEALQWTAARFRTQAATTATEPLKSWTRERAMRFEAFVSEVDRSAELKRAERLKAEAEALCAKGELARAREQVRRMPVLKFPSTGQLAALRQQHYLEPLARFSRQNPAYYRAFQEHEPDAAAEDIASLKQQLSAVGVGAVTPQTMLGFELLSAVLPAEDPLLADRATLASAGDYFEQPDSATLERWRRAQAAVRTQDWPTAVAQMQAIERTKVRTRQPFRAAYARAVLRNTPDRGGEVYAYLEEAARAGDKGARAWVSQEDVANGRWRAALPWLEARVADGEADAVATLLKLYAQAPDGLPRDPEREAALL
ncbi:MAG TPA: hypothetical protein VEQ65_03865, partial [Opitutus sp.]|nr:hypothetical protein [Opitutus sp.]